VNFWPLLALLVLVAVLLALLLDEAALPELLELLEHAAAPMASPPARAAHSIDLLIAIYLPLCRRCRRVRCRQLTAP
jgi:hypothetical protein